MNRTERRKNNILAVGENPPEPVERRPEPPPIPPPPCGHSYVDNVANCPRCYAWYRNAQDRLAGLDETDPNPNPTVPPPDPPPAPPLPRHPCYQPQASDGEDLSNPKPPHGDTAVVRMPPVISAPGWRAIYVAPNGTPYALPLAGWASSPDGSLCPMVYWPMAVDVIPAKAALQSLAAIVGPGQSAGFEEPIGDAGQAWAEQKLWAVTEGLNVPYSGADSDRMTEYGR